MVYKPEYFYTSNNNVGNFFLGCYLLDDNTLKGAIYLSLWVIFYAVTTVICYMVFFRKK